MEKIRGKYLFQVLDDELGKVALEWHTNNIDDNPFSQGVFRVSDIEIIFRKLLEEYKKQELDKAREEKIQNIFTREECVIVEPRYISDWSDKYNKHFKCNRCKSKCLIPVIEPLVVICPKCGELDLDEIS